MTNSAARLLKNNVAKGNSQSGFSLTELLISLSVLLAVSTAVFDVANDLQSAGGYQAEVQAVLANTRLALQTIERYVRQAGNDPTGAGNAGIVIVGPAEVTIKSDITGSAGPDSPDKGDPDGDTSDSGETVSIRHNGKTRSLEVVPGGGPAQIVTGYISGLSFRFYDADGHITSEGSEVRRISVTIDGTSLRPDPKSGRYFGVELNCDILVLT